MSGQLNDLDGDSLLMLYVSGELSNGEKAALERRLASEPALAAELEKLRAAQAFCAEAFAAADATATLPVGEGVAVRRVSRAMQQWQVDRIRVAAPTQKKGLPLPWWSYPVAVAASVIIGFLVWSSRQSVNDLAATPSVNTGADPDLNNGVDGMDAVATAAAAPDVEWLANSFGGTTGDPASAAAAALVEETPAPGVPTTAIDDSSGSMFPTREETLQ
jgi:anti-sigma factor RsiW